MDLENILSGIETIKIIGSTKKSVTSLVSIKNAAQSENYLSWCSDKNLHELESLQQGTVIVSSQALQQTIHKNLTLIIVEKPRRTFQKILANHFVRPKSYGIASTSQIDRSTTIGKNSFIGHNVVILANCSIGDHCTILHNTVILEGTQIGENVAIGSNCTIGGTGFGYEKNEDGLFELIPHVSYVKIMDDVEIGNNTCIDRGVIEPTYIGRNVKIDNLVHIAHGVHIEDNSMIIANSMIAGSVHIGKNSWIAPSSCIKNGLLIGQNSLIGMGAVVVKNTEENAVVAGNPAKPLIKP